jgi:uncharacterized protein (TIGR03435 family)
VLDRTGLAGSFEVRVNFDMVSLAELAGMRIRVPEGDRSNLPSFFTALQEQLGLKLQAERVPARVLIVEHVEPPSEN